MLTEKVCACPAAGAGGGSRCAHGKRWRAIYSSLVMSSPPTRNGTISSDEIFTTASGMNELSIPNYLMRWFNGGAVAR